MSSGNPGDEFPSFDENDPAEEMGVPASSRQAHRPEDDDETPEMDGDDDGAESVEMESEHEIPTTSTVRGAPDVPTTKASSSLRSNAFSVVFVAGIGLLCLGLTIGGIYSWFAHTKQVAAQQAAAEAIKARETAEQVAKAAEEARAKSEQIAKDAVEAESAAKMAKVVAENAKVAADEIAEKAKAAKNVAEKVAMDASEAKDVAEKAEKAAKQAADDAIKSRDEVFEANQVLATFVAKAGAVKAPEQEKAVVAVGDSKVVPEYVKARLAAGIALRQAIKFAAANDPTANDKFTQALKLAQAAQTAVENESADERSETNYIGAQIHQARGEYDEAIQLLEATVKLEPGQKILAKLKAAIIRVELAKSEPNPPKSSNVTKAATIQFVSAVSKGSTLEELDRLAADARVIVKSYGEGEPDSATLYTLTLIYTKLGDHWKSVGKAPNIDAVKNYSLAIETASQALRIYRKTPAEELDDLHGTLLVNLAEIQEHAVTGRLSFESQEVIRGLADALEKEKVENSAWKQWSHELANGAPFKFDLKDVSDDVWRTMAATNIAAVLSNLNRRKSAEEEWSEWASNIAETFEVSAKLPEVSFDSDDDTKSLQGWRKMANGVIVQKKLASENSDQSARRVATKWVTMIEDIANRIGMPLPPKWGGIPEGEVEVTKWQVQFIKKLNIESPNIPDRARLAREAFAKGVDFFIRKCRPEAEEQFTAAIRLSPRNPAAFYLRALTINDNWWSCYLCGHCCASDCGNTGPRATEASEDIRTGVMLELRGLPRDDGFVRALEKIQGPARNWFEAEVTRVRESLKPGSTPVKVTSAAAN